MTRTAVITVALTAIGLAVAVTTGALPLPDRPLPHGARTWLSGAWTGGTAGAARIEAFGRWRGSPADTVTTYASYDTWDEMAASDWTVTTFAGFPGRLVFGLPLLPSDEPGTLADVGAGAQDHVWRAIAKRLVEADRKNSFVRIGLEANGTWAPWGASAATAGDFRAAFRRVATVMRQQAPDLVFVFDIACGRPLDGSDDRLASLTLLYPGDDVVDVIGCDHYDSYSARATTPQEWQRSTRPAKAAGLRDVVDFARTRHKQFAVPEWGLTYLSAQGSGDNPFFINAMHQLFLQEHDILAFENYFNEADPYLGSAVWDADQNPESARLYAALW